MALVAGLLLTTITFLSVETGFRVLADETNQVSVSLSLYQDQTLRLVTEGQYYYGRFRPMTTGATRRGGLFPFCMCVMHSLFGYNGNHGFVVNFIAGALILAVVIRFGQKMLGLAYGLIAAVLLASFPLYALLITSSAFEVVNLLCIVLVFYQLHRFLTKPDGPQLEILLLLTVLASQCRYETVLLILPVAVACYWKRHALASAKLSWRLAVIPLLFLPLVWQRIATANYRMVSATRGTSNFSLDYFWTNVAGTLDVLLNPMLKTVPSSALVSILALVGCGLLVKLWFSQKRGGGPQDRVMTDRSVCPAFFGLVALGLGAIAVVHMFYGWNDVRHPVTVRFVSVYLPAICLLAAYPLQRFLQRPALAGAIGVVLLALLVHGLRLAARNEHGNTLSLFREYKRNLDFLKGYPKDGTLVVAERQDMYAIHEYGAIKFSTANARADELLSWLRRHLYKDILVIQKIHYRDQQPEFKLSPKLALAPVHEYQNGGDYFIRISKVLPPPGGPVVRAVGSQRPPAAGTVASAQQRLAASGGARVETASRASKNKVAYQKALESPEVRKAREAVTAAQKKYGAAVQAAIGSEGKASAAIGGPLGMIGGGGASSPAYQKAMEQPEVKKAREEYMAAQKTFADAVKKAMETGVGSVEGRGSSVGKQRQGTRSSG